MPLVTSGVEKGNLRELALARMDDLGLKCRDVRTREAGIQDIHHKIKPEEVELVRRDYTANEGWETFLSYEDARQDILVGLLQLRKCGSSVTCPELMGKCSIVRELHVYGTAVPVHGRDADKLQHQGYGTLLMEEAERIACREHRSTKIAVISGVGTRHYYRKLGYELEGPYMAFQEELLKACGKAHGIKEVYEALEIMRSCGVENWSMDLISSLPYQTPQMWEESLRFTVQAQPNHVSVYDLQAKEDERVQGIMCRIWRMGQWIAMGINHLDAKDLAMDVLMLSLRTARGLDLRSFKYAFGGSLVYSLCKVYKPYMESGHVVCLGEERRAMTADEFNNLFTLEDGISSRLAYIRLSDPDGFLLSNELISLHLGP
ncbi:hypothetical protein GH714_040566 [Hevea brasiliensis]|uniref:Elongator complex protein 3 n=1 Tax=Hevea brasiliensis TaxID=3981 RepID=A0A6A6KYY6_HEVBR|nr:hypothetical protein GH714_040566 [Hevea brasiliensis]